MSLCFVGVRRHNVFMTELLSVIAAAVADAGYDVDFAFDEFPPLEPGRQYVVIPHEFLGRPAQTRPPSPEQRARTIALCTENPGTRWFESASRLIPQFGAAVAFNTVSVGELRRRGIACEHFQLGYSPLLDDWHGESVQRPIDLLYLGARDPRRDALLASCGARLWHRRCELLVPALEERGDPAPNYLLGADKRARLRQSHVLLNLHRAESQSLEWVRYLEAVCNGCVVVTEPCVDHEPLIPGEHFVSASVSSLPFVADAMLDDLGRLDELARDAYRFIRAELTMRAAAERVIAVAQDLAERSPAAAVFRCRDGGSVASEACSGRAEPDPPAASPGAGVVTLRDVIIQTREVQRDVAELAHRVRTGAPSAITAHASTPTFEACVPRVTVTITLYNLAHEVVEALASVAALEGDIPFELLILDDASTDESLHAAAGFLERHPWLPARLLHRSVNAGLGKARNALLEQARGELVLILDADNGLYPSALERLCAALDDDPEAAFAYPMIAAFRHGEPVELMGAAPWRPQALRNGNFIDAMALLRRDRIIELGGYVTDPRLTGWEDFYLWCTCAEAGEHGVHVPQVLAWYRDTDHSMISEMVGYTDRALSLMRERFPGVLAAELHVA